MGKSFFRGTDSELFTGSNAFSAKINQFPEMYGLLPSEAEDYALANAAYAEAYQRAASAATATPAAVQARRDAKKVLRRKASLLTRKIAGTETVSDAQKLTLGLSVRAAPSPLPPPGKPDKIQASVSGIGEVILTWICDNPPGARGTLFRIWRSIDGGNLEPLGIVGKKRFVDDSLTIGFTSVEYRIQAVRSTAKGDVARFTFVVGMKSANGVKTMPSSGKMAA